MGAVYFALSLPGVAPEAGFRRSSSRWQSRVARATSNYRRKLSFSASDAAIVLQHLTAGGAYTAFVSGRDKEAAGVAEVMLDAASFCSDDSSCGRPARLSAEAELGFRFPGR